MVDQTQFTLMAHYNQWMNQKLYGVCATIPDRDRKRDLGAFFKSIHGTLNHLLYGDKAWMGRFTGHPFTDAKLGQDLYADFDELRQARAVLDQQILTWAQQLQANWLHAAFQYTSSVDGQTRILPTWVLVTHMFNHQTHHRGQLTTLIKQLGYEPGITDLPWLPALHSEAYANFEVTD